MLISEFARETGLSVDTVRFYIRKGLLDPETGRKGGSKPYQIFTADHVQTARIIRTAQSLGFSLKDIAQLGDEYRAGGVTTDRNAEIIREQLDIMEGKAQQLAAMIAYMRAKLVWLETGQKDAGPSYGDSAGRGRSPAARPDAPGRAVHS